jgi:REP element-mobilizing transposase RayT
MTMDQRAIGWLNDHFHHAFREIVLHGCFLYRISVPVYCLMPDHLHLLVEGLSPGSDQRLWARHFRKHLNAELRERASIELQQQGYEHVLRQSERGPDALLETAGYIRQNPVRAGIVKVAEAYPYTGCVVPGYPEMRVFAADYWIRYARVMTYLKGRSGGDLASNDKDE